MEWGLDIHGEYELHLFSLTFVSMVDDIPSSLFKFWCFL